MSVWVMVATTGEAAGASPAYSTVALAGQPAPGLAGITFHTVADPRVAADGSVMFLARLQGSGVTTANEMSIWTDRSGSLAMILRQGGLTPDGEIFTGLGTPQMNSDDLFAITAGVGSGASNIPTALGMFDEDGVGLQRIARDGDVFSDFGIGALNDSGALAFRNGNGSAVWSTRGGSLTIAIAGQAAPGISLPNARFANLNVPSHNAAGAAVFFSTVNSDSGSTQGIWTSPGSEQLVLAAAGGQALAAGVTILDLGHSPRIDSSGRAVFFGALSGANVNVSNDSAYLAFDGSVLTVLAREGDAVAELPGLALGQLPRDYSLAGAGRLAFTAALVGPGVDATNNSAQMTVAANGSLDVIVREGDAAQDVGGDAAYAVFTQPLLSESGAVAFTAFLRGTAVTQASNTALVAGDDGDELVLVARTGQLFEVASGDVRTINHISFDQGRSQWGLAQRNESGRLVFKLAFTNGTHGLFAADLETCAADFDGDGFVTGLDFDLFVGAFEAGDPTADFDDDGFVTGLDFDYYVFAYEAGC